MKILRVSTVVRHFQPQFRFPGAAAVGRPIAAEIAHLAGSRELGQLGQCAAKNGYIALPVVWRPKGAADGMIDKYGTGRRDSAHDVVRRANGEGRNSFALDHVGDETDGLMAEGSVGRLNSNRRGDLGAEFCAMMGRYSKGMRYVARVQTLLLHRRAPFNPVKAPRVNYPCQYGKQFPSWSMLPLTIAKF
jgi:hypothetical protein